MAYRRTASILVGAVLALLGGCHDTQEFFEVPLDEPQSVVSESDGLRLTFEAEKIGYELGEPVALTLKVENISGAAKVLPFANSCLHDLLAHHGGVLVWSDYYGETCLEEYTEIEMQPEELLTLSKAWDQRSNERDPVGPGTYKVRAVLLRSDAPVETDPLTIVIR